MSVKVKMLRGGLQHGFPEDTWNAARAIMIVGECIVL